MSVPNNNNNNSNPFIFAKRNYILMIIGVVVIFIGLILMNTAKEPYGYDFVGLTLSPLIILIGFAIEFFAIMLKNPANESENKG